MIPLACFIGEGCAVDYATVNEIPDSTIDLVRAFSEGRLKRDPSPHKFKIHIIKTPVEKLRIRPVYKCNICEHIYPIRPLRSCEYCHCSSFSQTAI
jgi:hypothetical protein